jgi:hypothetical protein
MGRTKTCQNREQRATSVEADTNARHAVPAVPWTLPFRQSPMSLFHATANMTAGTARMSKFIAKTTTSVVVIVAFVRCRTVWTIVPARQLARTGDSAQNPTSQATLSVRSLAKDRMDFSLSSCKPRRSRSLIRFSRRSSPNTWVRCEVRNWYLRSISLRRCVRYRSRSQTSDGCLIRLARCLASSITSRSSRSSAAS